MSAAAAPLVHASSRRSPGLWPLAAPRPWVAWVPRNDEITAHYGARCGMALFDRNDCGTKFRYVQGPDGNAALRARVGVNRRRLARGDIRLAERGAQVEEMLGPNRRPDRNSRVSIGEGRQTGPATQGIDTLAQLGHVDGADVGHARNQRLVGKG